MRQDSEELVRHDVVGCQRVFQEFGGEKKWREGQ